MERCHLIDLSTSVYEHVEDNKALKVLKKLDCFEGIIKTFLDWSGVKADYVVRKASNYHVTHESCPELATLVSEAISVLGIDDIPRVYLQWGYDINGYTHGYKDTTMMVLNSGVIDLMSDVEQTFVIGHELGHIKSKHVIYHTLASIISQSISKIPVIGSIPEVFVLALNRWSRMSEFTADRAGLLACQDVDAALTALVKMSGIPEKYFDRIDIDAFLHEAESLNNELSFTDKAFEKIINMIYNDHPWTVVRAYELKKWVDSGEYQLVLDKYKSNKCPDCGQYCRQTDETCPACGYTFEKAQNEAKTMGLML
jgi:Zn-dependent protease with chaperone function